MAKKIKEQDVMIMMDDVSPLDVLPKNKKMKKTSKYYKKKKTSIFQIISESNNFFILPTVRIYFDKYFSGGYDKLFLEFSWFNRTFAIKLK